MTPAVARTVERDAGGISAPDPYDTGLRSDWYNIALADLQEKHLPWDYEPDGGDLVNLPSCWNMCRPEYFYYEGSAWYSRNFHTC